MASQPVLFSHEKETMLITLFGRALQSRSPNPVLPDQWAEDAIRHIDYDFTKLKVRPAEALTIAVRAKEFDLWTTRYLADHPQATVLHLGCGMDSRVFRINPPAGVRWYDVDYPETIDLRRRIYPERPGYHLVGASLADTRWLNDIPRDIPVLVVAEGVMMYLTEDIVRSLLNKITGLFPCGQLVFDLLNRLALRTTQVGSGVKGTGASFGWGLDHAEDIRLLDPRIQVVRELRTSELAAYSRLPVAFRALATVMDAVPSLRRMNRLAIFRF